MTNLEKVQFLYNTQNATKDDVYEYVKSNTITATDYKTITGENCPELPLDVVIQNKINELGTTCMAVISGGFNSNCLGTVRHFDTDGNNIGFIQGLAAKASLIKSGATLQDNTLDWKAADEAVCHPFTADQTIALGVDLSTFMTTNIKKKEQLQAYVKTLTNINDINNVTWDTVIPA
ncbi:XkdX family protein [Clostridium tyrobutyricum]|uniref:XkdX family protein n=1 Tax=Clostridium tyrobutyricum TaxID=1519 RepID=UPI001C389D10|nr:XkdX family protein [Clostridium tyrobutyricum]MBV4417607.1 XkdX family protein [Clostridium tyrobutyricum]